MLARGSRVSMPLARARDDVQPPRQRRRREERPIAVLARTALAAVLLLPRGLPPVLFQDNLAEWPISSGAPGRRSTSRAATEFPGRISTPRGMTRTGAISPKDSTMRHVFLVSASGGLGWGVRSRWSGGGKRPPFGQSPRTFCVARVDRDGDAGTRRRRYADSALSQ